MRAAIYEHHPTELRRRVHGPLWSKGAQSFCFRPNASEFALFAELTDSVKPRKPFTPPSRKWSKDLFQSALLWRRASKSGLENALEKNDFMSVGEETSDWPYREQLQMDLVDRREPTQAALCDNRL
jgi:hypothetical protein